MTDLEVDVVGGELPPGEKESKKAPSKTSASKAATVAGQLPALRSKAPPKMETPRTGRRMSGAVGGDPFDGDNLDDVLKSLISTKKMDSAYQRMGRRLLTLEAYIEQLRGGAGEEAFITRKEFIEFLQKSEADAEAHQRAEREARLAAEEARRLEEEERKKEENPILIELRSTLHAQDVKQDTALKQAMDGARKADVAKWGKMSQLEELIENVRLDVVNEGQQREASEVRFQELVTEIHESMKELETRLQSFAVNEAHKIVGELLFNGDESRSPGHRSSRSELAPPVPPAVPAVPAVSVEASPAREASDPAPATMLTSAQAALRRDSEVQEAIDLLLDRRQKALQSAREGLSGPYHGPEQWRVAMLTMVDSGLLQPLREQVERLHRDLTKQRDVCEKKNRSREKEIAELHGKAQKAATMLREEADVRKQESFETAISFQKVHKVILEAKEKTTEDLQQAMDRIRTCQNLIDGHTKQIDGHRKEILKCATSEEVETLKDGVEKCVGKEAFSSQMFDLKSSVMNQGEKLGSIDLQVSMLIKHASSPTSSGRRRDMKKMNRLKHLKRDGSLSGSFAVGGSPQASMGMLSFFGDEEEDPTMSKSSSAAAALAEDFDEESEYSDDPVEEQTRDQVEGICMGLVCLAQHVLRGPPLVGLSRQNRLLNEKELLEELQSLRYWVTHRRMPPDWSLDRLTTVALRYSNPNPMEVHGPQPEMATILRQASREGERGRYPLDPSVGSIGISGSMGSSGGGGAGIMGGPLEDATLLPNPASKLPMLEGNHLAPMEVAKSSGSGWRSRMKMPLTARELRGAGLPTL